MAWLHISLKQQRYRKVTKQKNRSSLSKQRNMVIFWYEKEEDVLSCCSHWCKVSKLQLAGMLKGILLHKQTGLVHIEGNKLLHVWMLPWLEAWRDCVSLVSWLLSTKKNQIFLCYFEGHRSNSEYEQWNDHIFPMFFKNLLKLK